MSLPAAWVDALFARLSVRYGAAFLRQWEGLDVDKVKADWGKVLAFFADQPAALSAALDELPRDFPPNAMQLRDAALRHAKAVDAPMVTYSPTAVTREQVLAAVEACKRIASEIGVGSGASKAWAYRLAQREIDSQGRGMTLAQREMWRDALGVDRRMPAEDAMSRVSGAAA